MFIIWAWKAAGGVAPAGFKAVVQFRSGELPPAKPSAPQPHR